MLAEQQEAWQAVFEIHSVMPQGWVLVGGQAVFLHAVERGAPYARPTKDADMALDIRAYPTMLHDFTELLVRRRFKSAGESPEGYQHRWERGQALVDVLIPRHLGNAPRSDAGLPAGPRLLHQPASKRSIAPKPSKFKPEQRPAVSTGPRSSAASSAKRERLPSSTTPCGSDTSMTSLLWPLLCEPLTFVASPTSPPNGTIWQTCLVALPMNRSSWNKCRKGPRAWNVCEFR